MPETSWSLKNTMVNRHSPGVLTVLTLAVSSSSCMSHEPVAASARPGYAVPKVMQRQIENAVDAGDGDYVARSLRQKLIANPDDLAARLKLAERYQQAGF